MTTPGDHLLELDDIFTENMFRTVDNTIEFLRKQVNYKAPDSPDGPIDDIEFLHGVGFVVAQRYLAAGGGWCQCPKPDRFHHGAKHKKSGLYYAEVINAAANFWKHSQEERDLEDPGKVVGLSTGTRKVIEQLGVSLDDSTVTTNILYELGFKTFLELQPVLEKWNGARIRSRTNNPRSRTDPWRGVGPHEHFAGRPLLVLGFQFRFYINDGRYSPGVRTFRKGVRAE